MPVMDEFKEEREALKHGTPKEKLNYFLDYYKWHVVIAVAAIIFVVSLAYQMLSRKDNAFFAAIINGVELNAAEEYNQSFAEYAGIDTDEYDMRFDSSMRIDLDNLDEFTVSSSEKLVVYIAGKEIDVIVCNESIMGQYASNDTFWNLNEFLTDEQIAQYEPFFYYVDWAQVEAKNNQNMMDPDYEYKFTNSDPRNPDAMTNPVPVGIYLDNAAKFMESYYYSEDIVIGVVGNTTRPEAASKYIDFLLQPDSPQE